MSNTTENSKTGKNKKNSKFSLKNKFAMTLVGLSVAAATLVPAVLSPPVDPVLQGGSVLVQSRSGAPAAPLNIPREADYDVEYPQEVVSEWTNDNSPEQSGQSVTTDIGGDGFYAQDELGGQSQSEPVANTALPPVETQAAEIQEPAQGQLQESGDAEGAEANSRVGQSEPDELDEPEAHTDSVLDITDEAGAVDITEETVPAEVVEGTVEESTEPGEAEPDTQSLEAIDEIQGEEMVEDVEALMYKPVETRVGELQTRLMELGYMEADPVPQEYDALTQLGVMYFQRNHGLGVTGIADDETMEAALSPEAQQYAITLDMEGEDVRQIQSDLARLGHPVTETRVYDQQTQDAVIAFQELKGLPADGVVDMSVKKAISVEAVLNGMVQASAGNAEIERMIAVAEAQLGKPYILGAKGGDAFDCSGLVYYCLNQSGYQIGYMVSGQWAATDRFKAITNKSDLKRGDILCFQGHVGIYLGDNTMIDASSSQSQVRLFTNVFDSSYWVNSFICGKRVFE